MVKTDDSKEKTIITVEQALELIVPGDMVHTYRAGTPFLLGADWQRDDLIEAMKNARGEGIEVAGYNARKMKHAVAFYDDLGPVFVETDPELVKNKYPLI